MYSKLFITITFSILSASSAYTTSPTFFSTKRSTMVMRKGRPSLRKTVKGDVGKSAFTSDESTASAAAPAPSTSWVPVSGVSSMSDLPQDENKVTLVDTMAPQLINKQTNPTGAVSVTNYKGKTYCFASSCPACKIPMNKAKIFEPNEDTDNKDPRIACDFCSSTYNMRTGEKLETNAKGTGGIFGGVAKALFSAQPNEPIPVYALGEKNKKVYINVPPS